MFGFWFDRVFTTSRSADVRTSRGTNFSIHNRFSFSILRRSTFFHPRSQSFRTLLRVIIVPSSWIFYHGSRSGLGKETFPTFSSRVVCNACAFARAWNGLAKRKVKASYVCTVAFLELRRLLHVILVRKKVRNVIDSSTF